jgi:hypothetical protein
MDLEKKRTTLFQTQIANQGGICVPNLAANSSSLTYIVLEESIVKDSKRSLKLLHGIPVDINGTVKVVGTQWLSKCLREHMYVDTKEFKITSMIYVKDKVNTQYNKLPFHQEYGMNGSEDPDLGDLSTFTVEHSLPKKLKPEVTEVCRSSLTKNEVIMEVEIKINFILPTLVPIYFVICLVSGASRYGLFDFSRLCSLCDRNLHFSRV